MIQKQPAKKLIIFFIVLIGICVETNGLVLREGNFPEENENQDFRFLLIDEIVNGFEGGISACLEENATLAVIDNKEKFDFIENLVSGTTLNYYIGLKRKFHTESFDFVDGLEDGTDKDFFGEPFLLPWADNQPNNLVNDNGEDNCVEWTEEGWFDVECTDLNSVICRRECSDEVNSTLIVSECFNEEFEFIFINGEFNFDEAVVQCDLVDAKVGRIQNEDEFTLISEFMFKRAGFESAYVGLKRFNSVLDPSSFSFTDNVVEDKSFFGVRGITPWRSGEPNDGVNSDEACVEVRINENEPDNWVDVPCTKQIRVLCQQFIGSSNVVSSVSTEDIPLEIIITVSFVLVCLIIIVQVITFKLSKELLEKTKFQNYFNKV